MSGRLGATRWAALAIAVVVLIAHAPFLLGFVEADPLASSGQLTAAQTAGPLPGLPVLDPDDGVISQALGHRAALDWVGLHAPWWNGDGATGAPLAGEMQSAALFAPTMLTLLSNGLLWEHMLLELVCGLCTYLLARRLGLAALASTVAGVAYALNGTYAWFGHAVVNPIAFAPALLLGIESAYQAAREHRRGGWWLIALAGALSVYAGFPEVAYIDALLAAGWLIWRAGSLRGAARGALLVKTAAATLAGTLLAAPQLVAFLGYLPHADVGLHATSQVSAIHVEAHGLAQLVLPYAYGPLFARPDSDWGALGGYLAASLVALAALGLLSPGRRGLRALLAIAVGLTLARIYGVVGLGDVLGLVPGMSRVEFARYAFPALELAVVLAAALGLDALARDTVTRRRALATAGGAALVLVSAGVAAAGPAHRLGAGGYLTASLIWGGLVAVVAVPVALRRGAVVLAAVVVVDALVMFAVPELSAPRSVRVDSRTVAYLKAHVGLSRFVTLGPFAPNYGAFYGVRSLNLSDGMAPDPYARLVRTRLDPAVAPTLFVGRADTVALLFAQATAADVLRHAAAYREAAVSYVILRPGGAPASSAGLTLVSSSPEARVYHLAGSQPYFTAAGCEVSPAGPQRARVRCPRPSLLVRRETAMPGWNAAVDGRPAPVRTVAGLYQSVRLPAGEHEVSFGYAPPGIGWGWAGLAAGLAWTLAGVARGRAQASRAGSSAQGTITASS